MTAPNTPQRGVTPASTSPLSAMPGSTVRVTHDPIVVTHCLQPAPDERHLCLRLRGHHGVCIAWSHWPQMHVTPDNPKWKAAS